MTQADRVLDALPARPLADLVRALASIRGGDGARPLVSLQLCSGRELVGSIVAVDDGTVLIRLLGGHRQELGTSVGYASLSSIEALVVQDGPRHAQVLSGGRMTGPVAPAPSRLDARRAMDQHRAQASELLGVPLTWSFSGELPDGEALRAVVDLSSDALAGLKAAALDELGRKAIGGKVRSVVLGSAERAGVELEADTLKFTAPLGEGSDGRLGPEELRARIESLF